MVGQQQASQRIPLEPWEVGGELLDILSRGLYTDAKDALREYVQNSVDAVANNVHITIDGPVVTFAMTDMGWTLRLYDGRGG